MDKGNDLYGSFHIKVVVQRLFIKKYICMFLTICISLIFAGCEQVVYFNYPGGAQIIGQENELYIFLQIQRQRASSYRFYDAPSTYVAGNIIKLLKIKSDGSLTLEDLAVPQRFNLNPNLSHLFLYQNEIYFFASVGDRIGNNEIICVLNKNSLNITKIENENLMKIINKDRFGMLYENINKFSQRQGAEVLLTYYWFQNKSFKWSNQQVSFYVPAFKLTDEQFKIEVTVSPLLPKPIVITVPVSNNVEK